LPTRTERDSAGPTHRTPRDRRVAICTVALVAGVKDRHDALGPGHAHTADGPHTVGSREIVVGLIDGPVACPIPISQVPRIHEVPGGLAGTCERASSAACRHGTFVAGYWRCAESHSALPSARLHALVRPIFAEGAAQGGACRTRRRGADRRIMDCVEAGVAC